MGKGKKSTSAKRRPVDGSINEKVEEAKENKDGKTTTCQGQPTIHSFLNLNKPLRNNPLNLILDDNTATDRLPKTSEQSEVKDAEPNAPKKGDTDKQSLICGHNEQTDVPHKGSGTRKQTKSVHGINGEKSKDRKSKNKESEPNRKVTDYFPVRRSCRKGKAELKCEKRQHLDDLIKNNVEEGLKVKSIDGRGRGVFADRTFQKDQFVVEYHGELLEIADAKARESQYAQDPTTGCYMYYFRYHDKTYCVDATKETDRLGRLINHSKNGNLRTKLHEINGTPHLIFLASRDIKVDEELLYDYGDRSKEAIAAHPWLKH
ncbi:lysine methyltransferase 5Ab [Sinocyclocheilus rhinocerous]|uniref:[histone H4]-lysine(20) N-methyltransferase n=1 Tax=Sinocyclocheilus rhinocerous TaxID=307959 RepID=A0A673KTF3_9TELE|nr:PREDICTED: N-lysine methyltransferase KMT5A-A-like [Sinocyclocheilus rhinocerous]